MTKLGQQNSIGNTKVLDLYHIYYRVTYVLNFISLCILFIAMLIRAVMDTRVIVLYMSKYNILIHCFYFSTLRKFDLFSIS